MHAAANSSSASSARTCKNPILTGMVHVATAYARKRTRLPLRGALGTSKARLTMRGGVLGSFADDRPGTKRTKELRGGAAANDTERVAIDSPNVMVKDMTCAQKILRNALREGRFGHQM